MEQESGIQAQSVGVNLFRQTPCSDLMSEQLEKACSVFESGESGLHDASSRGSPGRPSCSGPVGRRMRRSTTGEVAVMVSECVCL